MCPVTSYGMFTNDRVSSTITELCNLLSIEKPTYYISPSDAPLSDTHNDAAAHFSGDPFLARVGAIGLIRNVNGSREVAQEVCAVKVVKYLIRMVKDDISWEERDRRREDNIREWKNRAAATAANAPILSTNSKPRASSMPRLEAEVKVEDELDYS